MNHPDYVRELHESEKLIFCVACATWYLITSSHELIRESVTSVGDNVTTSSPAVPSGSE